MDEQNGVLTDYLNFSWNGADTTISIDHNAGNFFQTTQQVILQGVDITAAGTLTDQDIITNLIAANQLIVDT